MTDPLAAQRKGEATRERICEAVQHRPGIHKSALAEELGLGWGTITYQLRILSERGLVQSWSRGREVRVFPATIPSARIPWLSALHDPPAAGIITDLAKRPGQGVQELSRAGAMVPRVVRRHLASLRQEGIVRRDTSLPPRYWLTANVDDVLSEGVSHDELPNEPTSDYEMSAFA